MPANHRVGFNKAAVDDLKAIYAYLAEFIGHDRADDYVSRIEEFCRSLDMFPYRGRSRDDLLDGLRSIVFESRAVIAYRIAGADVEVMRVIHGAPDYDEETFR